MSRVPGWYPAGYRGRQRHRGTRRHHRRCVGRPHSEEPGAYQLSYRQGRRNRDHDAQRDQ